MIAFPSHKYALVQLGKANFLSFLAQIVQIGTVPPLIALRLEAAGTAPFLVGLVAAAPWIGILAVGRSVPRLLQRYGLVRSNWSALLLSMIALVGMLFTLDPLALFLLNLLFGIGLIIRWVACDTWIVEIAPEQLRGRAIGTHETLMGCGIAVGPLILALWGSSGAGPILVCIGLLGLSVAFLPFLSKSDAHPCIPNTGGGRGFVSAVPTAIAAGCLAGFAETSSVSFLPIMGARQSLALGASAVLAGFGLGGTLLQIPLGWLADRVGYRRAQLVAAGTVLASALLILLFAQQPWLLSVVLFFFGGAVGGMNTLAVVEAGQRVSSDQISTAMMAIALSYTVGSIVGPTITGFAMAAHPTLGLSATIAVASAVFLVIWLKQRSSPAATQTPPPEIVTPRM